MRIFSKHFILAALWLAGASLYGQAYTEGYLTISPADGPTQPNGIDANDQITGFYIDEHGTTRGFLWSGGVRAQIDQPHAMGTMPLGISSTRGVVGFATKTRGGEGFEDGARRYKAVAGASDKQITGINEAGTFVGFDNRGHAFVNSGGVYTEIVPAPCAGLPKPVSVHINGINKNADFVGYCYGANGIESTGFARVDGVDREIRAFSSETFPMGINDSGTIAGYYADSSDHGHGFLMAGTSTTQFDFGANANGTLILGINNKGSLVGTTFDSSLGYWVGYFALTN